MLSCSTAYLSRIERGTAQVSEILIVEISTALNIEKNWFFPNKLGVGPLEIAHVVRSQNRRPLSDMYTRSEAELGFRDELLSSSLSGQCYLMMSPFRNTIVSSPNFNSTSPEITIACCSPS